MIDKCTEARSLSERRLDVMMDNCTEAKSRSERRLGRALSRFYKGFAMGGQLRLLTLTTSPEFKGGLHRAWRKFVARMRRRGVLREYYCVKEKNHAGDLEHLHVVIRATWLDWEVCQRQWRRVSGARWIHLDKVYSKRGMASYLAKYLLKGQGGRGRSFWYAYGWVFRTWAGWSRAMYRFGEKVVDAELLLVRELVSRGEQVGYMNFRLMSALLDSIRAGVGLEPGFVRVGWVRC